ncbi:hypothetical protein JCM10908_004918 [Rhodotorula pacifica]|uniref:ERMES complex subunit MDM34 n=1 Tax=Rhodotorula pacifica TaxID=1495444 RepID=UPI003179E624
MSFNFEWPQFSEAFYDDAREMLAQALNKGTKPPIIADRIEVKELNMGTIPPELEILEIGDLSTDRFRGIFRLTYSGDAYIVLQTRVQANPLNVPRPSLDILNSPRILFAAAPLVVPMTLRLSNLSLRAIVVLVVSRQKGITLVFKNDPLEKVDVSSSFDGVESVAGFIQREIENQLREAFRSDLPSVIHRLSQKWLSGEVKSAGKAAGGLSKTAKQKMGGLVGEGFDKDAKIETRTAYDAGRGMAEVHGLNGGGVATAMKARGRAHTRRMSARDSDTGESIELDGSQVDSTWSTWGGERMNGVPSSRYSSGGGSDMYPGSRSPSLRRLASNRSAAAQQHQQHQQGRRVPTSATQGSSSTLSHDQLDSVPESIESYDPTYGLRPDSIPHHAGFRGYEKLVKEGSSRRGLGDVLEDAPAADGTRRRSSLYDYDDEEGRTSPAYSTRDPFDDEYESGFQSPHDNISGGGGGGGDLFDESHERHHSFETIPAVGGGTITRPRVFHTQSQMRFGPGLASSAYDPASAGSLTAHGSPSSVTARSATGGSTASTLGLGRSASFYGHMRSASAGGGGGFTPMPAMGLARFSSSGASSSGASSARFPFPRHPPPSYSVQGASRPGSSIVRNTSMPALSRQSTRGGGGAAAESAGPGPVTPLASPSLQRTTAGLEPDSSSEPDQLAFTRPSPVDLLSRSPSSLLNTSFLDEEHLPITLNPSGNDSCAHLATLTSSNQTLSPFTRDHAHVTARSSPHLGGPGAGTGEISATTAGDGSGPPRVAVIPRASSNLFGSIAHSNGQQQQQQQPVKAVRKRLHRIGSAKVGSASSMSALSGYASPGSPAMPSSPVTVSASAFGGPPQQSLGGNYSSNRSSSIPSSSAYPHDETARGGGRHRRANSAYSSLSPSRYAATASAATSPRMAPSPFSVTRGKVSLASDYGSAMATTVGVGAGAAAKTAPSELSDYFPPAVEGAMVGMEALAGSSARELLSRMGLH